MPPLLPEYLSQPVQIVIDAPSTDWSAIVAGGLFTLAGAAIGAGLGSVGAYLATNRANRLHARRHKLSDALSLVGEIEQKVLPLVGSIVADADRLTGGGMERIKQTANLLDTSLTDQLNHVLLDCMPELRQKSSRMHILTIGLQSGARQTDAMQRISADEYFSTPGLDFQCLLGEIKSALLTESKKRV